MLCLRTHTKRLPSTPPFVAAHSIAQLSFLLRAATPSEQVRASQVTAEQYRQKAARYLAYARRMKKPTLGALTKDVSGISTENWRTRKKSPANRGAKKSGRNAPK
jgi:hypothetical protein